MSDGRRPPSPAVAAPERGVPGARTPAAAVRLGPVAGRDAVPRPSPPAAVVPARRRPDGRAAALLAVAGGAAITEAMIGPPGAVVEGWQVAAGLAVLALVPGVALGTPRARRVARWMAHVGGLGAVAAVARYGGTGDARTLVATALWSLAGAALVATLARLGWTSDDP